jgi:hypothetical protein
MAFCGRYQAGRPPRWQRKSQTVETGELKKAQQPEQDCLVHVNTHKAPKYSNAPIPAHELFCYALRPASFPLTTIKQKRCQKFDPSSLIPRSAPERLFRSVSKSGRACHPFEFSIVPPKTHREPAANSHNVNTGATPAINFPQHRRFRVQSQTALPLIFLPPRPKPISQPPTNQINKTQPHRRAPDQAPRAKFIHKAHSSPSR